MQSPVLRRVALTLILALTPSAATLRSATVQTLTELGRPFIENFTARDYRGVPGLFAPTQGPDGAMYFVNWGAVVIYDGSRWERIVVSDRPLLRVLPATDGALYVSPVDDFGRVRRDGAGKWNYESLADRLPAEIKPLRQIWTIMEHEGDIFFTTPVHVVRLTKGDPTAIRIWKPEAPANQVFHANTVQSPVPVLSWLNGKLFVFQLGAGLREYRGGDFVPFLPDCAVLKETRLASVVEGLDGNYRALRNNGEVIEIEPDGATRPWPHEGTPLFAHTILRGGSKRRNGGMLLLTGNNGAVVLGPKGDLRHHLHEGSGLESNVLLGMAVDNQACAWMVSMTGVSRVDLDQHVTMFDSVNGLGRTGLHTIVRHEGKLHGASEEGAFQLTPGEIAKGTSAHWSRMPAEQFSVPIRFFLPRGNDLVVGTNAGLAQWKGDKLIAFGRLPGQATAAVAASAERLVVGFDGGVQVFGRTGEIWQARFPVPGINSVVLSLAPAGGDNFWVGTLSRSLLRIVVPAAAAEGPQTSVRSYGEAEGLTNGGRSVFIANLPDGPLFYSDPGLFGYDAAADRIRPDTRLQVNEQPVRKVTTAHVASDGRLFAQIELPASPHSEQRLGWFARDAGGKWKWTPLPSRYVNRLGQAGASSLFFETQNGQDVLWATGGDALLRIALNEAPTPVPPPRVVIRSADRGPIYIDDRTPRLPFSTEPIRIRFASSAFRDRDNIRFQTRLVGYDQKWSAFSQRQEIEFTNLAGGSYTFEVRARNGDGITGEVAALKFSVAAPWHLTPWAIAGYVLGGLATIAGLVRVRVDRAERERLRLEKLVAQRTVELKVAKDAADEANRAKSTFLANMSHELRTPLNGVIGYAQVLMKDRELSEKNRERLRIVQTSGEHLLRMINEVLDFSKIEAGKMELVTTPFHLPQLLRDIAAAASPRFEQKGLDFIFDPAADLPDLVLGDPQKLRQVIDNLLGNAAKFTATGTVRFRAYISDLETVEFSVSDTGVGIAAQDIARLFQPFQQAVDGRPPEPGTGLGLAISQRLVTLMGSSLGVESQPGQGSRFFFAVELPVLAVDATAQRADTQAIVSYRGARRHLLIVDDVATNRHVLRDLLTPLGFTITEAASGAEALGIVPQVQPELIFLDLRMPGIDGFELARRLRERPGGRELKIFAMSASVLSFNREKAFAAGCDDFLPKPFREEDLLSRLGLALQLEWVRDAEAPAARPASRSPFPSLSTRLSNAVVEELLTIARRGEIAQLRRRFDELKGDPLVDSLDVFVKTYRMERIREALERHLSSPSAS